MAVIVITAVIPVIAMVAATVIAQEATAPDAVKN